MRSLRSKMILLIGLPTLVIYVAILGASMMHLRREARADVERAMTLQAAQLAARFDDALDAAAAIATTTARFMENAPPPSTEQVYDQLTDNVLQDPAVYGAAMAFEPADPAADLLCPYVYRGPSAGATAQAGTETARINIGRDVYDWYSDPKWQWYQLPKQQRRGVWSDPYFDEGAGNVLMVTYSEPFSRAGAIAGVTTVDIMLPSLRQSIGERILGDLDFVIVDRTGRFIFTPDYNNIMKGTIADEARRRNLPALAQLGERLSAGQAGVAVIDSWTDGASPDTIIPGPTLVFFAPIKSTGWSLAARVPLSQALAKANARALYATTALAATLVAIIGCIWIVSGRISRPLATLRAKVQEVSAGNLAAHIEHADAADEIGDLARAFNKMSSDLGSTLDRLARERAGRAKTERDLDIAREIQRGLLPTGKPSVPGFEIAGWNRAADKTGGDFFDWLALPDGRTILIMADVTGHGIGPALIVSACRAYIRASASSGDVNLAQAMARVNNLLTSDMPSGRFVTAAVGILDPARSEMTLLSAGQAPIIFFERASGETQTWAADTLPLGLIADLPPENPRVIPFRPGDSLVLVTDGFFEWQDHHGKQFGIWRLEAFVRANHALAPEDFIQRLYREVVSATGGTEQSDDLTALIIRRT